MKCVLGLTLSLAFCQSILAYTVSQDELDVEPVKPTETVLSVQELIAQGKIKKTDIKQVFEGKVVSAQRGKSNGKGNYDLVISELQKLSFYFRKKSLSEKVKLKSLVNKQVEVSCYGKFAGAKRKNFFIGYIESVETAEKNVASKKKNLNDINLSGSLVANAGAKTINQYKFTIITDKGKAIEVRFSKPSVEEKKLLKKYLGKSVNLVGVGEMVKQNSRMMLSKIVSVTEVAN